MATATQQDDDLLIITEDDTSASTDATDSIEFSFDDSADEKDTSAEAPMIDLTSEDNETSDISVIEEMKEEVVNEVPATEELTEVAEEVGLDFNFDTWAEEATVKENSAEETSTEETTVSEEFSFDLGEQESVSEEVAQKIEAVDLSVETPVETNSGESLNDILSGTIAKLEARKATIASDKSTKSWKEEEIKKQIKTLQAEVETLEADMKMLDSESDKITANIAELENMKLDPVKEHNAKRVVKK